MLRLRPGDTQGYLNGQIIDQVSLIGSDTVHMTCPPKTDPHVKLERWIEGRQGDE
jgi:hypothetical protein